MKKILDWLMNKPINTYLMVSYSFQIGGNGREGNVYILNTRPFRVPMFIDYGEVIESIKTKAEFQNAFDLTNAAILIHSTVTISEEYYYTRNSREEDTK